MKPGREAEWPAAEQNARRRSLPTRTRGCASSSSAAEPGTLPRFELKAKRLKDERPIAVY